MKKITIELERYTWYYHNYGWLHHPTNPWSKILGEEYIDIDKTLIEFEKNNKATVFSFKVRDEHYKYYPPVYKTIPNCDHKVPYCDCVIYIDILYHDNNSLLEENKKLKTELKALSEKYNAI